MVCFISFSCISDQQIYDYIFAFCSMGFTSQKWVYGQDYPLNIKLPVELNKNQHHGDKLLLITLLHKINNNGHGRLNNL